MVAARVLVLTVCFAFAALSQTAHLQPAPEVKLPILSDSSSPAHWVGGTFYLFQSGELATPDTMRAPLRFQGTDFAHLGAQIPSSIPGAPMSVWIESTWLDTNGRLYAWYHREPSAGCPDPGLRLPEIGALRSDDNGATFTDLGVILRAPADVNCSAQNGFFAGGNGDFSVLPDRTGSYFYFLFTSYAGPADQQGVGIARMAFADRDAPVGKVFKYRSGQWTEAGLGGQLSPIFPANVDWRRSDTDSFWGPSLHYNSYLDTFVVLMNRSCCSPGFPQEGIYVAFNRDIGNPAGWSTPTRLWAGSKQGNDPFEWYGQVLGTAFGESDKLASQTARFFVAGTSDYEVVFTRAAAPVAITTAASLPAGVVGAGYSTTLAAAGGTPPYRWSVISGALPGGLTLDAATGAIAGTLNAAGTFGFTAQVSDSAGVSASQAFTIVVTAGLSITTGGSLPAGVVGAGYSTALTASGGTPPYRWSLTSGALPGGLTLDAATGTIGGTLTTPGTFAFTAQVTDSAGRSASQAFTIVVTAGLSVATAGSLPGGVSGTAYTTTLAAAGGTPPYRWSLTSGTLPGGLALDAATGRIVGTLTTAGTFAFTVQVTDNAGRSASQSFTLVVSPAPDPLRISTAATLPGSATGTVYLFTLSATGGVPPYRWSVVSGVLPPGLQLTTAGVLSGTPSTAGNYAFAVQAADSAGNTSQQSFALAVIATPSLMDAPLRNAASYQATAAPGSIVSIFGADLAPAAQSAGAVPLPLNLNGASVTIDGIPAPLFYVSATQINAQVPFEVPPGSASVVVTRGNQASDARTVPIAAAAPGIFTVNQTGAGPGIVVHASDYSLISTTAPAHAGEYVILYCTGLGALQTPVRTGDAPPSPPPTVAAPVQVTFAGVPALVSFAGVAPGLVGLYQVNARIADSTPAGSAVSVQLQVSGIPSNVVTVAIQ